MNRRELLDRVREVLAMSGFYVSDPLRDRCIGFDQVARRDKTLLVIKALSNVDSLSRRSATELGLVSSALSGAPLLVGLKSGGGALEAGVVYSRFGIPIISLETFEDFFLEGVPPFISSAPGGLYVRLDEGVLRRARENRGVSLGSLAEIAGVSRRAIQMYQQGMGATIETAIRLEAFLGEPVVKPINPLERVAGVGASVSELEAELEAFEEAVFSGLRHLGYSVTRTAYSPFDAISQDARIMFLCALGTSGIDLVSKATAVANISRVVERDGVLFVDRTRVEVNVGGTPVISREELRKVKEREEIVELISERKA